MNSEPASKTAKTHSQSTQPVMSWKWWGFSTLLSQQKIDSDLKMFKMGKKHCTQIVALCLPSHTAGCATKLSGHIGWRLSDQHITYNRHAGLVRARSTHQRRVHPLAWQPSRYVERGRGRGVDQGICCCSCIYELYYISIRNSMPTSPVHVSWDMVHLPKSGQCNPGERQQSPPLLLPFNVLLFLVATNFIAMEFHPSSFIQQTAVLPTDCVKIEMWFQPKTLIFLSLYQELKWVSKSQIFVNRNWASTSKKVKVRQTAATLCTCMMQQSMDLQPCSLSSNLKKASKSCTYLHTIPSF